MVQFIATEKEINRKRNSYRPVAAVSAMLYFIIDKLKMLDHMYQYSFLTFMGLVTSTIAATEGGHHDEALASVPSGSPAAAAGGDGYDYSECVIEINTDVIVTELKLLPSVKQVQMRYQQMEKEIGQLVEGQEVEEDQALVEAPPDLLQLILPLPNNLLMALTIVCTNLLRTLPTMCSSMSAVVCSKSTDLFLLPNSALVSSCSVYSFCIVKIVKY